MGSIVVVVVLSFLKLLVEHVDVVDDLALKEPVKLLGVDAVGAFDLAAQAWSCRSYVDVVDALTEHVPVERLPELGTVIGLDFLDREWQLRQDVVDELDRRLLVVLRVGAKYPHSRAVVDGGVLVVTLLLAGLAERLDELHIDLQRVAWALHLITLPPGVFALVTLRRR